MNGKIELIIGPMFAGKSTELLRLVKRYQHAKKKCLIVSYIQGIRQSDEDYIVTHDQQQLKATQVEKLEELSSIYKNYDVIAIDEGQFFPDIDFYCELFANQGKIVIVAALNSTFQRKEFGKIGNLVPISESVTKLTSICAYCSSTASFTKRIVDSTEIQLIGGADMYRPVCRKCYFAKNQKIKDQFWEKETEENKKLVTIEQMMKETNVNQKLSD